MPITRLSTFFKKHPDNNKDYWVDNSDTYSFLNSVPSRLAATESFFSVLAIISIFVLTDWILWISILLVPVMLMRTSESEKVSLNKFALIKLYLDKKFVKNFERLPVLYFLVLSISSVYIKVIVGTQNLVKLSGWKAIPRNYRNLLVAVDAYTPPELIPGMERAALDDPSHVKTFTFNDIWYDRSSSRLRAMDSLNKNYWWTFNGILGAGSIMLLTFLYRWVLKGAVAFHFPLLFVNHYNVIPRSIELSPQEEKLLLIDYKSKFKNDSPLRGKAGIGLNMSILFTVGSFFVLHGLTTTQLEPLLNIIPKELLLFVPDPANWIKEHLFLALTVFCIGLVAMFLQVVINITENRFNVLIETYSSTNPDDVWYRDKKFKNLMRITSYSNSILIILASALWIQLFLVGLHFLP